MKLRIAALSGSLRKESYTTKLIKAFQKLAPEDITVDIIPIGDLPHINQDLEDDLPETVKNFHQQLEQIDGILLATPEYNRSYSPVIKNALDWGSRPQGKNKWAQKPAIVVGCTPYTLGAFGAQHHLRQVLVYLDVYPLQQPEFYLTNTAEKFDNQGNLTDKETEALIKKVWESFVIYANKLQK